MWYNIYMKKEKKVILLSGLIVFFILIIAVGASIYFNNYNQKLKQNKELYLVIYQYQTIENHFNNELEPVIYQKINFTYDTNLELDIISLDQKYTNHLCVKQGKAYISEANCLNQICLNDLITLDIDIINNLNIVCMPSGLLICLEEGSIK